MCNVEDDGDLKPLSADKRVIIKTCVKCEAPAVLITRIHDPFCKECFQVYVVHRFRAAIGKSKLIRDGERVLVAFSGGTNSAALLHLIEDGLSKRAHKKLRFIPSLLHVDETSVLNMSSCEQESLIEKVSHLMSESGFPSYFTRLELGLALDRSRKENSEDNINDLFWPNQVESTNLGGKTNESLRANLNAVLKNIPSTSSQEDFIRNLRNQLLVCIARQMGFTKILTAECSTRLGVRILTDVAQGRGSQVALNTGFSDARNGDILFVRPVRDLNAKELTMYTNLFNVDSVFIPCITTKDQLGASIERLTESFVAGLQADYQSTVSNIVRTSEKLGLPDLGSTKCILCQSPLDTNVGKASALSAVEFSLKLSQMAHSQSDNRVNQYEASVMTNGVVANGDCCQPKKTSTECCGEGDGSCQSKSVPRLSIEEIMEHLCYGCRLSLRNFKGDWESLPLFVTKEAELANKRIKMREEIADFLLDDEEEES